MTIQDKLKRAQDAATSAEQLAELVGQGIEVNRALARHPNANAELLEELMEAVDENGFDDQVVRQAVVCHPNVSANTFGRIATLHPLYAIKNPRLHELLLEAPALLVDCSDLLELQGCPESWLKKACASKTYSIRLKVLRNPGLPEQLRKKIAPVVLNAEAEAILEKFESKIEDPVANRYVNVYRTNAIRLPYAIPNFLPFDSTDPEHRLSDQVICGFPFTSKKWPWPQDADHKYMQPVAQINLTGAGEVLGQNLGEGLLQLWFSIDPRREINGSWDPILRCIPKDDLGDEMDSFYPSDAPWLTAEDEDSDDPSLFALSREVIPSARVSWVPAGSMFPRPYWVWDEWGKTQDDYDDSIIIKLEKQIEKLSLPSMGSRYLDKKSSTTHLGGYVFGYGNEANLNSWTDSSDQLLFYVREEAGMFAMAVTFSRDDFGKISFRANLSCDR